MLKLCKAISTLESLEEQIGPTNTRSFYALSCVAPAVQNYKKGKRLLDRSLRIDGQRGMESCF
jgi:hypothetical protein